MAKSGFEKGFTQARLQGVKTGLGMAGRRTGFASGFTDGTAYPTKLQDPVLLASARNDCPYFYWNSDNMTLSGNNVTAVTNLLREFNPLTQSDISAFTVAGDPLRVSAAVANNKATIQFDSNDSFGFLNTTGPNMTNTAEMTLMMVCRATTNGGVLFCKTDETTFPGTGTSGDLIVETTVDKDFQITYLGDVYSTSNYEIYKTNNPQTRSGQWVLLTVKARLSLPKGSGTSIEIYVNGTKTMINTFGPITSFINTTWSNRYIAFGNGPSLTNGGSDIAAGLIIEQYINESEQLRLENYFRDYYGIKF